MQIDLRKIFYIFAIYFAVVLLQGCFLTGLCNCKEPPFPYFNYKAISVSNRFSSLNETDPFEMLFFLIKADSGSYVAHKTQNCNSSIISQANACSCAENGDYGQKFKIKKINVYPDSIFNAAIPLGEPINNLLDVQTSSSYSGGIDVYTSLDDAPNYISAFSLHRVGDNIALRLKHKPIAKRPYKFRIELIKENNEKLVKETDFIAWE